MIYVLILFLVFVAVILFFVWPRLQEYRATLGIPEQIADAGTFFERLRLRVQGLKTVLVGLFGALLVALPDALQMLVGVDLTPLLGQSWGSKVAVAVSIGTAITHIVGVLASAKAEPVKDGPQ